MAIHFCLFIIITRCWMKAVYTLYLVYNNIIEYNFILVFMVWIFFDCLYIYVYLKCFCFIKNVSLYVCTINDELVQWLGLGLLTVRSQVQTPLWSSLRYKEVPL